MKNDKHTQVHWYFSPGGSPHYQGQIYREDGRTIAITYNDEDGVNARLIAAAPELLEALEKLIGLVNYAASDGRSLQGDNWYEYEQEHLPAIQAAIAKAKGGMV